MKVAGRRAKMLSALTLGSLIGYGALLGCNSSSDSGSGGTSQITVAGKLSNVATASFANSVNTFAAADYKMYCITFSSSPTSATSDFGSDGAFSLSLPASTPFGCFVNKVSTNLPVATVMVQGSGTGFNTGNTSSMNLASSVDLGSLSLDLTNGRVLVPASAIASATAPSTGSGISAADVDNYEWTMSCVKTGNTAIDAACATFVQSGATVYLRVLQGSSSDGTGYGINVWGSYNEFNNCGGIDFNDLTKTAITGSGFTFATTGDYAPVTAASFSNYATGSNACTLRSDTQYSSLTASSANAHARIQGHYCLAPLQEKGNGYSFTCSDSGTVSSCTYAHSTSVTFTPGSSGSEMYGLFNVTDTRSAGCGSASSSNQAFNIKFTRGSKH